MPDELVRDFIPTNLWEKQSAESAKAFSAFKTYRDLHPSIRSLRKAVEVTYGFTSASHLRQFAKWSTTFSWVIRAGAWDEEKDRLERLAVINQKAETNKRHLAIAQSLQKLAIDRLKITKVEEVTSIELMLKLIEHSYNMEREILGMDDITITETELEVEELVKTFDVSNLTTAELRKRLAQRILHVSTNSQSSD